MSDRTVMCWGSRMMMMMMMIYQPGILGCGGTVLLTAPLGEELTRQPMKRSMGAAAVNSRQYCSEEL